MSSISTALVPGTFLVDIFPIRMGSSPDVSTQTETFTPTVKYVPEWFPGAGFKKFARVGKANIDHSITLPFQHVKTSFEVRESPSPLSIRALY